MKKIIRELVEFRDKRNWAKYHTAPELARALSIEASELNECFLWNRKIDKKHIAEEIADVLIYALYLCEAFDFVPVDIIREKIKKNAQKYPVDKKIKW